MRFSGGKTASSSPSSSSPSSSFSLSLFWTDEDPPDYFVKPLSNYKRENCEACGFFFSNTAYISAHIPISQVETFRPSKTSSMLPSASPIVSPGPSLGLPPLHMSFSIFPVNLPIAGFCPPRRGVSSKRRRFGQSRALAHHVPLCAPAPSSVSR